MTILADDLAARTREGLLFERLDAGRVRCHACGHDCPIPDGAAGVCKVRVNRGGTLMVPWGYVAGAAADPIEKKPFFHVLPGSLAYSFGMLGCDFHCAYCQNWLSSQVIRDSQAVAGLRDITPAELLHAARLSGARAVVSTYNEPFITIEWAVEIFRLARGAGLLTGFVSNGHATPQAIEFIGPWIDAVKIDLKSFDDRKYRGLGGRLQPVLDTIRALHARGIWIELVTLLVPGFNDSADELERLAAFIRSVSPDIPWHVTAFHADYKMQDRPDTSPEMLQRAAEIGRQAGLRFVYAGNLPGHVGPLEDTACPACKMVLIRRRGYRIDAMTLTRDGRCPRCAVAIPGRWYGPLRHNGTSDR